MTVKIDKKIVAQEVINSEDQNNETSEKVVTPETNELQHESNLTGSVKALDRPSYLPGGIYKINPAEHISSCAVYIIISDKEFPDGSVRPFELFLKSKDESSLVWVNLISRLVSSIWRQPRIEFPWFSVDEFLDSIDTRGSYYLPGGVQVKSLAHHVGIIVEQHCYNLGLQRPGNELSDSMQATLVAKKRKAESSGIKGAQCPKCPEKSYIMMDGCMTCVSCGYSKCG